MKSAEEMMEILEAFDLVCEGGESYRLAQATRGQGVTPLTTTA